MKHQSDRYKSRRITPWDNVKEITPLQKFISHHYEEHYMQRHPHLIETGEVELINSYVPEKCPYCSSEAFSKYGHTRIGVQRYQCANIKCNQTPESVKHDGKKRSQARNTRQRKEEEQEGE